MADAITTQVISDTAGVKYVVKRTNISDGTGETDSVLFNQTTSNFMTADATKTIAKVWYSINTANSKSAVEISWGGASANTTALTLSGNGVFDFRTAGNDIANNATSATGYVYLSTKNFALHDNYTLVIEFR